MRFGMLAAALALVAACDESSGDGGGLETTAPPPKKSGGFSAGLAQDLKKGSDAKGDPKAVEGDAKAGDTKAGDAKAGDAKAGDAKAGDAKAGDAKAGDAKAGDAKAGDPKAGDTKVGDAKAGDAKAGDPKAGSTKAGDSKPSDTKPGDTKPGDTKVAAKTEPGKTPVPVNLAAPRVAVKPPPELAAIKLSLEPNWDRDVGEAGTISLVVKVPNTEQTRVFAFRYGMEDPKAPTDQKAYKKWLADNGILKDGDRPVLDRQRGGAWYLEGVDGSGAPVFRIIVIYGGKKLICGGSLYRDAQSNQLGDIRDKTITQAKSICETLAL